MPNLLKKLAGQTAVYGLSSIVGRLLNYFLVPLYTRVFVTGEYGIITEMYAYVSFLIVILTYGMETGFFRFSQSHSNKNQVYATALISVFVTSITFIALSWFSAPSVSKLLGYATHPEYVIWLSIIVAIDAFTSIPFARLREQNKALKFALIRLVNIGVNIGLNLFWIVYCPNAIAENPDSWVLSVYQPQMGVGYVFLSNLIASILTLLLLLPELLIKWTPNYVLWKQMMVYSIPLLFAGLAGMVNETMDRILLKYLIEDPVIAMQQLGIYGANYKVSILMTLFIQTFRFAAEPFFFAQAKNKDNKQLYARVMHYFVIFCSVIFLGVMLYIDIVKLFIGSDFREGLPVVPILLMANFFLGIFFNLSIWYKLNNKTQYGAWLALGGALITLILNIILIPIMGYMGAAWTTLICYFAMMIASYILGQKYFPIPYNLVKTGFYIILAPTLWLISLYIPAFINPIIINSFILILFLIIIFINERKGLRI